jgi:hypothetical protein
MNVLLEHRWVHQALRKLIISTFTKEQFKLIKTSAVPHITQLYLIWKNISRLINVVKTFKSVLFFMF